MAEQCVICMQDKVSRTVGEDIYLIQCDRCGKYQMKIRDHHQLQIQTDLSKLDRSILSGYVRENSKENYILLDRNIYTEIIQNNKLTIEQKFLKLLKYIQLKSEEFGQWIELDIDNDFPIAYATSETEFWEIVKQLSSEALIKKYSTGEGNKFQILLTLKGIRHLGELNIDSKQIFIAMQLRDPSPKKTYETIRSEIEKQTKLRLYYMTAEGTDDHNNKICDEVIAQIRRSRFVIADITALNPNVFYEAGYAQGLGIPVIFTCEKNFFDKHKSNLPFDTQQYNVWQYNSENSDALLKRIVDFVQARIPVKML